MIQGMHTLGLRFDIDKVESGNYGAESWRIFWEAVAPEKLKGVFLFEGDTSGTLARRENVFCIAVQATHPGLIEMVKAAMLQSSEFCAKGANPRFIEGSACMSEPLPAAGRIDSEGALVGQAGTARSALGAIHRDKERGGGAVRAQRLKLPPRSKPASSRTKRMPPLPSFGELETFMEKTFITRRLKYIYWLTPEELCDVVEAYANLIEVQYSEGSCSLSEDMVYVRLFQKEPPEGNPIELLGMFSFPSSSDAENYWQEIDHENSSLARIVPRAGNIQGKWHLNFHSHYGNPRDVTYDKENDIPPESLWTRVCLRRVQHGLGSLEPVDALFEFICPHCKNVLHVPLEYLGVSGTCGRCNKKITLAE